MEKKEKIDVVVDLSSDNYVKQLKKVERELKKLGKVPLIVTIEQRDEPILQIIRRRIRDFLFKLRDR